MSEKLQQLLNNEKLEKLKFNNEKLNELLHKKEEEEKHKNIILGIFAVIGVIAAIALISLCVYKYLVPDKYDDMYDDDYDDDFDDDYIEFGDDAKEKKEEE
ncbi:MAG: DUF4366 domain-containing protein [Lachnospiraceae bacterium]|jgi:hypothetical protein|nr:DUF4366 domain-containing protein [Lachnospiraceae bacterium]MEE3461259.1 DUF4366 domain-containing protein [Lachnospiraceae bacterium]